MTSTAVPTSATTPRAGSMRRFGQVLGLRPERLDEYRRHHAHVWPEIREALQRAGIRNYSIFHFRGQLFGYFEYDGPPAELDARFAAIAAAPRMREWWDLMEPMQIPLEGRAHGEWWATMEEVFHLD
jgi:L-rhamnose mutarotase